jgi:putative spermidine/putrescine transport system permease protein
VSETVISKTSPSRASRWRPRGSWTTFYLPLAIFLTLVFVAPQIYFYRLAFAETIAPGLVDAGKFSLDNLVAIVGDSFWLGVIGRTLAFAAMVVTICLVLGFPLAYSISRSTKYRSTLLSLVIITSFTGVIVKVLGWRVLLGDNGPINNLLLVLHLTDEPIRMVNNLTGAVIGTSHAVLPFMILLLVPVIDQVPQQLEDAAAGLGSSRGQCIWQVVVPSCRQGLLGGALVSFAYAMGSFTTPALLGGRQALILPLAIREQFSISADYAFAAALALVLMAIVLVLSFVSLSASRDKFINSHKRS